MADQFKVAVVGGGLCGSVFANGLMNHPNISFDVYEAGSAFRERGASVGINGPAQQALEQINSDVRGTLERSGGVVSESSRLFMGEGPQRGKFIVDLAQNRKTINVHRAPFLAELLKPVPDTRLHVNKKLVAIEQDPSSDGELVLHFRDGTTARADAIIGCDGIHSVVRKHILGADHPALEPEFAGFWDFRHLVPIETAQDKMGPEHFNPQNPRQTGWCGDGALILHQLVNNGETAALIISTVTDETWDKDQWKLPLTREHCHRAIGDRGAFGDGIVDCIMSAPEPVRYSQWQSKFAPTYFAGRVCMMGDAAHAPTPWQGSGAGFALEDASVLAALLGKVQTKSEIEAAFKAFDEVRRPRTQRLITTSNEVGLLVCGKFPGVGLDIEKLAAALEERWEYILSLDVVDHIQTATDSFITYANRT